MRLNQAIHFCNWERVLFREGFFNIAFLVAGRCVVVLDEGYEHWLSFLVMNLHEAVAGKLPLEGSREFYQLLVNGVGLEVG